MHVAKLTGWKFGCLALAALMSAGCGGGDGKSAVNSPATPGPAGNSSPTITGQPLTSILAGQSYSFQPSATDPDGDTLTFSASNVPAWASFNAATGRLSGTPSAADVATYSGISISVSDGEASAALSAFSINVTAVGTGSATVSWTPPTQNSDGSTLTNLSGFEIRYGRASNSLSQTVSITNPSINSYVVENLTSGTWYFAVVAVATTGAASDLSALGSKTI